MSDEEFHEEYDDADFEDVEEVVDSLQELEPGSEEDETLQMDDYSTQDIDGEKEAIQMSRQWYKKIVIDHWATKLHTATMGIRQKDQYRAQSRQFTANMEVKGEIDFFAYSPEDENKPPKERGRPKKSKDYKEIFAYNTSFWDPTDKDSVIYKQAQKLSQDYKPSEYAKLVRRLVIKTFTELERDKKKRGRAGRWRGTIEESLIMSINAMFGENRGKPRPFFYINLPGYKYRIPLWRTHTFVGDRYTFTLPNPKTGEITTFRIKGKRFTPGNDFKVFNVETNEKVAKINDRAFNVGGKVTLLFYDEYEDLNRSVVFRRILTLFCAVIPFLDDIEKKYHRIYKALKKKAKYLKKLKKAKKSKDPKKVEAVEMKYESKLRECDMIKSIMVTNSELTLLYNPRRIRT
jgi:hypothetical protein